MQLFSPLHGRDCTVHAVEDLVSVRCFGFFFLLVIVVWIGEGVLLQISTCLSGFSLRKAGQGKEYTMHLERKVLRLATHLSLGESIAKPQAPTMM